MSAPRSGLGNTSRFGRGSRAALSISPAGNADLGIGLKAAAIRKEGLAAGSYQRQRQADLQRQRGFSKRGCVASSTEIALRRSRRPVSQQQGRGDLFVSLVEGGSGGAGIVGEFAPLRLPGRPQNHRSLSAFEKILSARKCRAPRIYRGPPLRARGSFQCLVGNRVDSLPQPGPRVAVVVLVSSMGIAPRRLAAAAGRR